MKKIKPWIKQKNDKDFNATWSHFTIFLLHPYIKHQNSQTKHSKPRESPLFAGKCSFSYVCFFSLLCLNTRFSQPASMLRRSSNHMLLVPLPLSRFVHCAPTLSILRRGKMLCTKRNSCLLSPTFVFSFAHICCYFSFVFVNSFFLNQTMETPGRVKNSPQ